MFKWLKRLWHKELDAETREYIRSSMNYESPPQITTPMGEGIPVSYNGGWTIPQPAPFRIDIGGIYGGPLNYIQPRKETLNEVFTEFVHKLANHGIALDAISVKDRSFDALLPKLGAQYYFPETTGSHKYIIHAPYGRVEVIPELKHLIAKYSIEMENVPD